MPVSEERNIDSRCPSGKSQVPADIGRMDAKGMTRIRMMIAK